MKPSTIVRVVFLLCFGGNVLAASGELEYPGQTWRIVSPETMGWSSKELEGADQFAKSVGTSSYLVIHNGVIVHEYGNVSSATNVHSARKSVLSVLFGIYASRGVVQLDKSLADLGIDDKDTLTPVEKQATVRQLLQARSGIYHRSAYETTDMTASHPERGTYKPGEYFEYNNWDFNALGTIFKMFSRKTVFESLSSDLAVPLQFENYSEFRNTRWVYTRSLSEHPAYEIRLSARDLGRIGLLMAREGKWKNVQILSRAWVRESTTSYSNAPGGVGYGYLWWVGLNNIQFGQKFPGPVYSARGYFGQYLLVDPTRDLVIVHRVNSDEKTHAKLGGREFGPLLKRILAAGPDLVTAP